MLARPSMTEIERLQEFLRAAAAPGREVVSIPPFTAYLDPADQLKYLNYAIPDADAAADSAEVDVLRRTFRERERLPRFEWIEEAAPRLAAALDAAGMEEELRTPLMACAPDELVEPQTGLEELRASPVGADDLREAANIQRIAFGGSALPADEVPRAPSGGAVVARIGGTAVSVAAWTPVVDGISEIVGVATAEEWRQRGLAGVVTAGAARAAFAAGAAICILSPGNETAQGVYTRAGFRRVATMLHWSDENMQQN